MRKVNYQGETYELRFPRERTFGPSGDESEDARQLTVRRLSDDRSWTSPVEPGFDPEGLTDQDLGVFIDRVVERER